uniref:RRM domain-containing protein n=1 Tax=Terrapene triunguis TaxID=2587831 RepID=A0A674K7A6_9SAUR
MGSSASSSRATRNLFIGNLDHNVSEVELRRAFEKYGIIEEVVIKRPARGQGGAYAFLKFQNLDMAHRAKVAMSGRVVGRNPIKIGYDSMFSLCVCHNPVVFKADHFGGSPVNLKQNCKIFSF